MLALTERLGLVFSNGPNIVGVTPLTRGCEKIQIPKRVLLCF
jgi:hypothetical protein